MIKNIDEIKRDFIRLRANEDGLYLEVRQIEWEGPHTPQAHWVFVKHFGEAPQENEHGSLHSLCVTIRPEGKVTPWAEVEKAVNKLLSNRRYFNVCGRYRNLNPITWMHDDFACQRCTETNLGIVY
jgi:hypothetical protein